MKCLPYGKTEYKEYSKGQHIFSLEKLNKNSKILSFERLYLLDVLIFVKNDLSKKDNKMYIFKKTDKF
jgi:hypothetical protein